MKPNRFTALFVFCLLSAFLFTQSSVAQIVNEIAKKRVIIGVGMFTDIWIKDFPEGVRTRDINQGFQTFAAYNVPFGKSNFGFSIGVGMRIHNLYGNFLVKSTQTYTDLERIGDSIDYKRSKLVMPFLELPIEFRFKSESKVSVGVGFKVAYMLPAHSKYVGENYELDDGVELRVKYREIENLEQFSYGPTLRIGYRWFSINGYYSIAKLFTKGKGPDMYPISVGFLLMPF
jgi:hypothetical protein